MAHLAGLKNFGFSYIWSGNAVEVQSKNNGRFGFLVHPALSHVSSDLLALTSKDSASKCVAQQLASSNVMSLLEKKTFYISSYDLPKNSVVHGFRKQLAQLNWLEAPPTKEYHQLSKQWKRTKMRLMKK